MATDYDAPRVTESDETDTSLEQLTASRKTPSPPSWTSSTPTPPNPSNCRPWS